MTAEPASQIAQENEANPYGDQILSDLTLQTDVPAVVFDREFVVRAANPAFLRMLHPDSPPEEALELVKGKSFFSTLENPSIESIRRLKNLKRGRCDQVQVWHKVPRRNLIPIEYSFVALTAEGGGQPGGLIGGFARDRTSDLLLIEQLAHLYDELDQRHQELKRLHRHIERLADTDELTSLANRRAFDAGFEREWRRYLRTAKPLSLILIDVDHFKHVNDRYGHVRGDYVLQSIGHVLRDGVRATDIAARYGGEEFAVILPETETEYACKTAQRLKDEVEALSFPLSETTFNVTLSAGIATAGDLFKPSDRLVLFVAADTALRLAKQRGRNRIEIH